MKRMFYLCFFLGLWSCGEDELIIDNETGRISLDFAEDREIYKFRDSTQITYSILFEDLPTTISTQDFRDATRSAFNTWEQESFYLRDGEHFSFTYQEDITNSDVLIRFSDVHDFVDNSELLPNTYCVIKCHDLDNDECSDQECDRLPLGQTFFSRSVRYPRLQINPQVEREVAAAAIERGLLEDNYWQVIRLFTSEDTKWEYAAEGITSEDSYNLENIILHEIGHFLGLSHIVDEENSVMFGTTKLGELTKPVTELDRQLIASAYPNENGKFPFFDAIKVKEAIISINDFTIPDLAYQEILSNTENLYLTLTGELMPVDMEVSFNGVSGIEFIDITRWTDVERRFQIPFSSVLNYQKANIQIFQNKGQVIEALKLQEMEILFTKKPGIVAQNTVNNEVVEIYFDGTPVNDTHLPIPLGATALDNGVFDPQSFAYCLKDESQGVMLKYCLVSDELHSLSFDGALFLRYGGEGQFIGIKGNSLVSFDVNTGTTAIINTTLPHDGLDGGFGAAINSTQQTYTYRDNDELITINYVTGNVVSIAPFDYSARGLAYSSKTGKYYCIIDDEITQIDITTGLTTSLNLEYTVITEGLIPEAMFIHPANNRYYYVTDNKILKGISLEDNTPPTSTDVKQYRFIKPLY